MASPGHQEGHLRARTPCPGSLQLPQGSQSPTSVQGCSVACRGQSVLPGSAARPGPGLAAGLQSAGLGRRRLEPSRKFKCALATVLAPHADPILAPAQPPEGIDHYQGRLSSTLLPPSPRHLDMPRLELLWEAGGSQDDRRVGRGGALAWDAAWMGWEF